MNISPIGSRAQEAMETAAGVLLVGGLGLIGAGLPIFI